ncbi:MAG: hypothetical protein RL391_1545 [Actinomycetota bacterium]
MGNGGKRSDDSWDLVRPTGQPAPSMDPSLLATPNWSPPPLPDLPPDKEDGSTDWLIGLASFIGMVIVGLVAVLIFHDDPKPTVSTTPVVSFTGSTAPAAASTSPVPTVGSSVAASTTTSTTTPGTAPLLDSIVVAGPDGIWLETSAGRSKMVEGSFDVVLDLGDGTFLVQARSGRNAEPQDTVVFRVEAGGTPEPVVTPSEQEQEWLTLHDAVLRDGVWSALVSVATGAGIDTATEDLVLVNLTTGDRELIETVGGWEENTGRFTFGGGHLISDFYSGVSNGPLFLVLGDTSPLSPTPFGLADQYDDCSVCPRLFAISPNGDRLAWIEADLLVVADATSHERVMQVALPKDSGTSVVSLEVGESSVILNRSTTSIGPYQSAFVVTADGMVSTATTPGFAVFSAG